jgi:hypothetical protein
LPQVVEHYGEVTPAVKSYMFYDLANIEMGMGTFNKTL